MAVRARLNAIVIDAVLIGVVVAAGLSTVGATLRSSTGLLVELGAQFAYFFVLEAVSGQTVGKRAFHVRVVGLDGAPITIRQAAIRNALRFADALPLLYASGLISMMRTGPAKRQRIGDVVAGTMLVVDRGGRPLRTPGWLLPVVTLLATALSIVLVVALVDVPRITPPAGFTGNTSQAPGLGPWTATATVRSSAGYADEPVGTSYVRAWQIARSCDAAGGCQLALTRQLAGGPPLSAELVRQADGWHATFPTRQYVCGARRAGQPIYWRQQSDLVLRFTDGGRTAQANERNFSYAPACGYGTSTVVWTATHL